MHKRSSFITITHVNHLAKTAQDLIKYAASCKIWLFTGELGAGKTTLIKAICQQLGVINHVTSPSFSRINTYYLASGDPLYHADAYRLNHQEEAIEIDYPFYFETGCYCFIEWPHKIQQTIPTPHISIEIIPDNPADSSRKLHATWVES